MKRIFSVAALIIISIVSCQKLELKQPERILESEDNTVSLSTAANIASNFTNSESTFLTRSSAPTVKETFTISDSDKQPLLHVINYEEGGFVLVAGDNRLKPIQAYSPKGCFSANKTDYPLGLKIWMEGIKDSLKTVRNNGLKQTTETQAAWLNYTEDASATIKTRSLEPGGGMLPEADTLVGPFITDSWHQKSPYNDSLDVCAHYYGNDDFAGYYKPVVGCVPLAIARILRYHHYSNSFSWNSMPDNTATAATKSFIKDVHESVKSFAQNNDYGFSYTYFNNSQNPLGFGVEYGFPIGDIFTSQYGYASGYDRAYSTSSYSAMRRDLIDHSLPCIIVGQSLYNEIHAWICDGYHYNLVYWYDNNNEPIGVINTYLHYCWGDEDPSWDGWFSSNSVYYQNASFSFNMRLTHHISPIDYWNPFL